MCVGIHMCIVSIIGSGGYHGQAQNRKPNHQGRRGNHCNNGSQRKNGFRLIHFSSNQQNQNARNDAVVKNPNPSSNEHDSRQEIENEFRELLGFFFPPVFMVVGCRCSVHSLFQECQR